MHEPLQHMIPIGEENDGITSASRGPRALTTNIFNWLDAGHGGGEESQIQRNDGLLKAIMRFAGIPNLPDNFVRNKTTDTTRAQRPDFTALFRRVPILIAEEKDGDALEEAIVDCVGKFAWIPNLMNLPMFFSIAICFSRISIVIHRRSHHPEHENFMITEREDRVNFLRIAVNLGRVLKHFITQELIEPSGIPWNIDVFRPNGKVIKLTFWGATVTCDTTQRYSTLQAFYKACEQVNHIEHLRQNVRQAKSKKKFYLAPIGSSVNPRTMIQFCEAIRCVITAIKGIHAKDWMHTDIRWANIVKISENNWCVIDCYFACKVGSQQAITRASMARAVWTKADDIAQIVQLFDILPPERRNLFVNVIALIQQEDSTVEAITALLQHIANNAENFAILPYNN
jgi:hypothetical protein